MSIEIELDAYIIPSDHTVWKSTAGKTHRFYRAVRDAKAIFPDIRGLDALSGNPKDWTDKQLLEAIALDRWNRDHKQGDGQDGQSDGGPKVTKQDRTVLTFLKRLWFDAKIGDLIVVPPDGWREPVLIGEVLSEAGDIVAIEAKDGEYNGVFYGRRVVWRTSVAKQDLTPELVKVVHTRTAVFSAPESVKEEVYRHAFGNFVYRDRYVSEFRTTKERFTTDDSVAVSVWLNGFDVLRNALEQGDRRTNDSFSEMGLDQLPTELAAEMKINIQSPGEIFVRTAGPFALSLMALFTLSACDAAAVDKDQVTVRLKTVGAGVDGVEQRVENDVNALKTALGQNRLREANKYGKRAKEDGQLTTRATLKKGPSGGN